jgi:predicted nucleic acid-binding protein
VTLYVLDTNVWSDIARGIGKAGRKLSVVPVGQVLIAAPALYELRRIPKTSVAWSALDRFTATILSIYEIAPFDHDAAEAAARAANALRTKGRTLQHLDILIAGIALARSAALVTRDKDFASVPGLRIESWQ